MDLDAKRRRVCKGQGDESCSQTAQHLAAARNELAAIKEKLQACQKKLKERLQFAGEACVYIAFARKADADCGDWRFNQQNKDKFDEELLGVFFSLTKANKCAKEHVKFTLQDYEDDEEDSDEDEGEEEGENQDDDDVKYFEWDNEDSNYDNNYHRVWVERKWIEDATDSFHP